MSISEAGSLGNTSTALAMRWHQNMAAASFKGQGAAFWDTWVHSLPPKQDHSGYVEEVLHRINCSQDDTVLDIGAGTGVLSLPLAKCARQVTALDHSHAMLETIAHSAATERLNNIKLLHLDWTKAKLGIDFDQHDIVIASRSLPADNDILRCLDLINRTARRTCYITWKANGHNPLEEALCTRLNIPYHPFPDYTVLCDIITSLGIMPSVEIFSIGGKRIYGNLEQAYIQIVRGRTTDEAEKQLSLEFLAANLECEDGLYTQPLETNWALISWSCSQNNFVYTLE